MRVRALDQNGDYTFGFGSANFLIDSPAMVQQKILTGLKLWRGEWFLDSTAGMPWSQQVLGRNPQQVYDAAIQRQILSTKGVASIVSYSSSLNPVTRALNVSCTVQTIYGNVAISLPFALPLLGGYGVGGYDANPYGQ